MSTIAPTRAGPELDQLQHGALGKRRNDSRPDAWQQDIQEAKALLEPLHSDLRKFADALEASGKLADEDVHRLMGREPPW
jgi:hypothetical protein